MPSHLLGTIIVDVDYDAKNDHIILQEMDGREHRISAYFLAKNPRAAQQYVYPALMPGAFEKFQRFCPIAEDGCNV
jgi:hypothetical protein